MTKRRSWTAPLASGALAGLVGGQVFLAAGLWEHAADLFVTSPYAAFAIWVIVRSVGLYGLLFAAAGLVVAGLLEAASRLVRRGPWRLFPWILGLFVATTVFLQIGVSWQIDVLRGLPLRSPDRWLAVLRHGLYGALAGAALALALAWLGAWLRRRRGAKAAGPSRRLAIVGLVAALVVVVLSDAALDRLGPPRADSTAQPGPPSRVVVVGLDGLTFRVLSPLLRSGELPAFRRLVEEGAWGSFLTYGTASSPLLWTTMATGKKVRDHGIDDFVKVGGGYKARPMRSSDRTSRAVWNIASLAERDVAVIHWLVTDPPEAVRGSMVPRLAGGVVGPTHPPELRDELERVVEEIPWSEDPFLDRETALIRRTFAVARHLSAKNELDLLAVYNHSADAAEHLYWKDYQPEAYDAELWRIDPPESDDAPIIPEIYRRLDHELGRLLDDLPDDALLLLVSDHGQRARPRPRVRLRLDRVLEALGHTRFVDGTADEVDPAASEAYAVVWTYTNPKLRVSVNLRGREESGIVDPADRGQVVKRVMASLESSRLADGTPLFGKVARRGGKDRRGDIEAMLSADLLARIATRGGEILRDRVVLGEKDVPLGDLLDFNVSLSGAHDRQGVIFLRGPGVRPAPIGQRSVTTPLQEIVWHLTDKVDQVDRLLPLLARLGLIDRASTLDVTPTVLYALGLPVGRDMAGTPRSELFDAALPAPEWIATYEVGDGPDAGEADGEADEEVLEQLRSLGYID